MDTRRFLHKSVSIFIFVWLAACGPAPSATPYLPPTPVQNATPPATPTTSLPTTEALPASVCIDNLTFVDDQTIPDGSLVPPGSLLDKQWLVQNSGNCNWDSTYRLRFVGGYALGAAEEQALYPARAGTQATLRILFTAPAEAGEYVSLWQAFDPNGVAFGEAFLIKVVVQP
jgi:hypothetical protein